MNVVGVPETLRAGDTWAWLVSVVDCPSSVWTLKFFLRGLDLTVINVTATADDAGDGYIVGVAAYYTKDYAPGLYGWTATVEKGAGADRERFEVGTGDVRILPDLEAATGATDTRSHARKMLDAIEAALEAAASDVDVVGLSIAGRTVQYRRENLIKLRSKYRREVARENGESDLIYEEFRSGR